MPVVQQKKSKAPKRAKAVDEEAIFDETSEDNQEGTAEPSRSPRRAKNVTCSKKRKRAAHIIEGSSTTPEVVASVATKSKRAGKSKQVVPDVGTKVAKREKKRSAAEKDLFSRTPPLLMKLIKEAKMAGAKH